MPGYVLGTGNTAVKNPTKTPAFMELHLLDVETGSKYDKQAKHIVH